MYKICLVIVLVCATVYALANDNRDEIAPIVVSPANPQELCNTHGKVEICGNDIFFTSEEEGGNRKGIKEQMNEFRQIIEEMKKSVDILKAEYDRTEQAKQETEEFYRINGRPI